MTVDRPDRDGARPDRDGAQPHRDSWSLLDGAPAEWDGPRPDARRPGQDGWAGAPHAGASSASSASFASFAPSAPEDPEDPEDPDDLDRAFGPDTASVGTRTPGQRVRRATGIGIGVIGVAAVIVVVLGVIIGSVQNGVGGIFPRPDAALDQFGADAARLDGVQDVGDRDQTKTSFASYQVQSTVRLAPDLSDAERTAVVAALSAAADEASGNGVTVFAVADLGALEVGVSPDADATAKRLELARALDEIGGVTGVRCAWGQQGPSDDPAAQAMTVETVGTGVVREAILTKASEAAQRVFPGATVTAVAPGA
jgi:hypothetical protein